MRSRVHPSCVVSLQLKSVERLAKENVNIRLASPAQSVRRPAVLAELAWARWQAGTRG